MTRDDLLRKIKALLRLGESDNVHESAAAIARAQALMEKHAIDAALLDESDAEPAEVFESDAESLGDRTAYTSYLARVLADANGCSLWLEWGGYSGRRVKRILRIVGKPSATARVRFLFAYCRAEIDRLTRRLAYGRGRTYANNFRIGCVDAIQASIREERERMRASMRDQARAVSSSALIRVDHAIANIDREARDAAAWAREALNLRGRARSQRFNSDPWARQAGKQAGASIYRGASSVKVASGAKQLGSGR